MVSKTTTGIIVIGGVVIVGAIAYFILKGGQSPQNANPVAVQAPTSVQPASLFTSTPGLTTGGSGTGNFTLQQTYSPYYSTENTYTNTTTTTTTSNPQTSVHFGIF